MKIALSQDSQQRLDALDSGLSLHFTRELEYVFTQTYDTKLPPMKTRMFIPVDYSVDPGDETYTYRQFTMVGLAKIVANYAKDFPSADVYGKEFIGIVKSLGNSYRYSVQEIRASKRTGRPLDQMKAAAARRFHDELIDKLGALGDDDNGLIGLINLPNMTEYTVPQGASMHTDFARKTPDEIVADLFGIFSAIVVESKETQRGSRLLLPLSQFRDIQKRRMTTVNDTTVLEYFLGKMSAAGEPVEVFPWERLNGAGAGPSDRMLAYDPSVVRLIIPMEFTQHPPQQEVLEFMIPCESRFGGVMNPYPLALAYGDGI